nr:protein FAR1-related sequence 5-like [Tanacetum cinerariifolium]
MTQGEKMFVVKAATNKIDATRAHNLLSSMKGGYEYVRGITEFGDIVSFDVTFNSNKYNMKFVPFIGIDNHEKRVTLGSEMLLHEDTKSCTWLLKAFMTAFLEELTLIVTDQDGAMKRAIEDICKEIYDETYFQERFDKIVWNMFIEPLKFEEKWAQLIEDFSLQSYKWMKKMFNMREIWILAYLIDSSLYGLMRTTSRSKSENSFFKSFTSTRETLEPHVQGIPIPVEGTYYDTIDEAIDMYTKYADMAGFEVKKSGQRLTKFGAVQHKYIMCNREGVPKGINVDTIDPEYSDKPERNTTTHVTGCKARIKLVLNIVTGRYKLEFHAKHNHMLISKEYKHLTKKQRKMTQGEKMFVVKAATNKIDATRAHNLLSSMKGRYEYVHGITVMSS